MADPGFIRAAPLDEDIGDAVGIEVGCLENQVAASVWKDRALIECGKTEFDILRKVPGDDGEAEHPGAVGADLHGLGIRSLTDPGDIERIHLPHGDDVAGFRDAGEDGVEAGFAGVDGEAPGEGTG